MKLNTTGIAGQLMLSLDRDVIAEKLIHDRRINPTPLQVRWLRHSGRVCSVFFPVGGASCTSLSRSIRDPR